MINSRKSRFSDGLRGGQKFVANLFINQQVTYSSEDKKWTYSPLKYWPTQGHIDFLAYAPYVKNTLLTDSKINFTVEQNVADQKDLLWANANNQTKTDNPVKFTFNHALSKIGYTVKLKEAYSNATITLNKITLAGSADEATKAFYKTGTIDLSKTSSDGLWTNQSSNDKQNFNWFSETQPATTITSASTPNPDTKYLFVIPQDFSKKEENADKLYVIVDYTIKYTKFNEGEANEMKSTVTSPIVMNFLQGKAYMINLTIGLTPIDFDADVTTWENGATIPDITWK